MYFCFTAAGGSTSDEPSSPKSDSPPLSPTTETSKEFSLGLSDNSSSSLHGAPPAPPIVEIIDDNSTDEAVFSDEEEEEKSLVPPPPPPLPPPTPENDKKDKVSCRAYLPSAVLYASLFHV